MGPGHSPAMFQVGTQHSEVTCTERCDTGGVFLVLTRAWVEAWSIAATDSEVLDSMSSKASSMFS